jgi:hypothetical protein
LLRLEKDFVCACFFLVFLEKAVDERVLSEHFLVAQS